MRYRTVRAQRALAARLTISLVIIAISGVSLLTRAGAAASSTNWPMYNGDYRSQRFAALDAINRDNVASLHKVCSFELGTAGTLQSGPIVADGTVYVTTQRDTVALDGSNCHLKWRSTYKPSETEVWNTNRGVAIAEGKLFRGTQDAHLIAIDAASGKQLWNIKAGDPKTGLFLSASPIVWNGLVFIGTAGADWGQKARMMAFSAADGHRVWNFDLIPTGSEHGAQTWGKASTASTGGGSTWTSYSLDTKSGLIYVPVGNPAPDFSGDYRPGANLYTDSLVVLDAKTGTLKWYYQLIAHDVHDYDLAAPPALVDTPGGKQLAIIGGKDCTLRALDRATGKLVYQSAVCKRSNTTVPPTPKGTRVCPGWIGGVEWNGPAYDTADNTVFVNSVDWCGSYHLAQARYVAGTFFLGGAFVQDPPSAGRGSLTALDGDTGAIKWKYYSHSPMVAAVTPTAGGLVFTGEIGGKFLALDSQTGGVRYSYDTKGAIAGGIVTYMQNDKQYVAVEAGNESRLLWITLKQHPTLYLFSN